MVNSQVGKCRPRVRGAGPPVYSSPCSIGWSSPRTRGWSLPAGFIPRVRLVVPACAGLVPLRSGLSRTPASRPACAGAGLPSHVARFDAPLFPGSTLAHQPTQPVQLSDLRIVSTCPRAATAIAETHVRNGLEPRTADVTSPVLSDEFAAIARTLQISADSRPTSRVLPQAELHAQLHHASRGPHDINDEQPSGDHGMLRRQVPPRRTLLAPFSKSADGGPIPSDVTKRRAPRLGVPGQCGQRVPVSVMRFLPPVWKSTRRHWI
jgi:hypothetical protein